MGSETEGGREGLDSAQQLPHFVFLTATMAQTAVKRQGSTVWFCSSELQKGGEVASFIRAQLQHPPGDRSCTKAEGRLHPHYHRP